MFLIDGLGQLWHLSIMGLMWVLPRVTGGTDPEAGISGRFYPGQMIREDERVTHSGNPSRWLSPGPYILSGILLFLAFTITVVVPLGYGEPLLDAITPSVFDLTIPDTWWYAPVLFVSIAAVVPVYTAIRRASTWHIVTDKRILHRKNVLAPEYKRIDLVDINSIDCRQSLVERWYNIGHIDIYTASTGGKELALNGVPNAPSLANEIDQTRYDYQQRIRGGYPEEIDGDPGVPAHGQAPDGQSPHDRREPPVQHPPREQSPYDERQGQQNRHRRGQSPRGSPGRQPTEDPPHRGSGGASSSRSEPNQLAQEGDSIEDQRPDHTLRDEIDDTFRGENS